ncbi:Potassium channel subfamily K member 18 [Strongyloides ratti]|uniref:Potassium channel subfamily K member 18 n=1 Tax=Strongyloides ratti TaxID=34506 RepID=A0A090L6B8_STRRB|nr:Potassium channel subfamily K member 18 [Strongyloides ratti]CEF65346.1 Potassium channel subfamily K member 18 [Strongyloides ratti]
MSHFASRFSSFRSRSALHQGSDKRRNYGSPSHATIFSNPLAISVQSPRNQRYEDEAIEPLLFTHNTCDNNNDLNSSNEIIQFRNPNLLGRTPSIKVDKYAKTGIGVVVDRFHDEDEIIQMADEELDDEVRDKVKEIPFTFRHKKHSSLATTFQQRSTAHVSWDDGEMNTTSDSQSKESDDEREEIDKEYSVIKKYAKLILPHVALVLVSFVYTLLGALLFYTIERPNEFDTKKEQLKLIEIRQEQFVSELINLAIQNITSREEWRNIAKSHMHNLSDHLFIAFEKYFMTSEEIKNNHIIEIWTFSTAVFFAVTVVTTIGYGSPVPTSQYGRIFCIIFSILGIPLTLVTIADMGKFLSEHLIWSYGKYLKMKHFIFRKTKHKSHHIDGEHVCDECQSRGLNRHMEVVEEQKIPALLVLAILVLYTALGGVLMSHLEDWSFFNSFYFSFITMTTVGFGDLLPKGKDQILIILIYIIVGLAITTMCIDLVGVQYIRKIHYFGRKIQDAKSALAIVGGKVVMVSEFYASLMQKRAKESSKAYIIENLYISKHVIPYIPSDIRWIRYIDQVEVNGNREIGRTSSTANSISSFDIHSCRFCHSRFSMNQ